MGNKKLGTGSRVVAKASPVVFAVGLILVSLPVQAHFKLMTPTDAIVTDSDGSPQKTGPCTGGTASNMVTKVSAGSMIHIKVTETVPHGGHYRVSLVPTPNRSMLVDAVPVVTNNDCKSVAIQNPPVAPVIADGLFVHNAGSVQVFETDVQLPNTPCADCTLQITQFMRPHAPGCYYYHCANLEIVDGPVPDGGVVVEMDAGTTTDGGPKTVPTDGGGKFVDGGDGDGPAKPNLRAGAGDDGCSVGFGASSGLSLAVTAGLVGLALLRRRQNKK